MKALVAALVIVAAMTMTHGQRQAQNLPMEQPAINPPDSPATTPQLQPTDRRMVEAWNQVVSSIEDEVKALKTENDELFQLQTSLKLHAPWTEVDLEGKQRHIRAALIEQIIASHQQRASAYDKRIALLRELQASDR